MSGLTIGQVTARTGVPEGTLRMWETRHRFPSPARSATGRRTYSEDDVARIHAVMRMREDGLSLHAAIARLQRERTGQTEYTSVFRAVRDRFEHLHPVLMTKPALLALTHAVEDECAARAAQPILFGCFQRERFYRHSQARWTALCRGARSAVVFADFPQVRVPVHAPAEVPLVAGDALLQEWIIVCEASELPACVIGWERPYPGEDGRAFEVIWTVEPEVVREAARVCTELAARTRPELAAELLPQLSEPAPEPDVRQLRAAVALATRVTVYASER